MRRGAVHLFKTIVGYFLSRYISYKISISHDQPAVSKLVEVCDMHPDLLRNVEQFVTVRSKFGFLIKCGRSDYIGRKIIFDQVWEPLVAETLLRCIRSGDTCIDIGSNIGFDTLLMSKAVGENGRVIAVEPDWINIESLIYSLRLNDINNVEIVSVAVGSEFGTAKLSVSGERGHSNIRPNKLEISRTQSVLVSPLESIVSIKNSRIRLIKLDIEGFEVKALLGLGDLLSITDIVICEVDEYFLKECGDSSLALFELMREFGFISCCADPESSEFWRDGDESFVPSKTYKSGHQPFDAIFYRPDLVDLGELLDRDFGQLADFVK